MNNTQAPQLFTNVHKIIITVLILGTPLLSNAMLPEQLGTYSLLTPELFGEWRAALDQAEEDQKNAGTSNSERRSSGEIAYLATHFQATKADSGWALTQKDSQNLPSFDKVTKPWTQAIIALTAFSVVKKWNPGITSVGINVHLTRETCTSESCHDYGYEVVPLLKTPGVDAHGVIDLTSKDDPQHGWKGGGLSIAHEETKIIKKDDFHEKVVMWGGKHLFGFGLMKPRDGQCSSEVRRDRLLFDVTVLDSK